MIEIKKDPAFAGLRGMGIGTVELGLGKGFRMNGLGDLGLNGISSVLNNIQIESKNGGVRRDKVNENAGEVDIDDIAEALVKRLRYLGYA